MSMSIHGFGVTVIIQPNERRGETFSSLPNVVHLIQLIAAPILYGV